MECLYGPSLTAVPSSLDKSHLQIVHNVHGASICIARRPATSMPYGTCDGSRKEPQGECHKHVPAPTRSWRCPRETANRALTTAGCSSHSCQSEWPAALRTKHAAAVHRCPIVDSTLAPGPTTREAVRFALYNCRTRRRAARRSDRGGDIQARIRDRLHKGGPSISQPLEIHETPSASVSMWHLEFPPACEPWTVLVTSNLRYALTLVHQKNHHVGRPPGQQEEEVCRRRCFPG